MKASLILHESSSNIVYFSGDKEFIDHFKKIDNEWQKEAGFDGEGTFTLEKLVQHFFGLPSLFLQMKAYHTPFHGFTTEDNLNIQVGKLLKESFRYDISLIAQKKMNAGVYRKRENLCECVTAYASFGIIFENI